MDFNYGWLVFFGFTVTFPVMEIAGETEGILPSDPAASGAVNDSSRVGHLDSEILITVLEFLRLGARASAETADRGWIEEALSVCLTAKMEARIRIQLFFQLVCPISKLTAEVRSSLDAFVHGICCFVVMTLRETLVVLMVAHMDVGKDALIGLWEGLNDLSSSLEVVGNLNGGAVGERFLWSRGGATRGLSVSCERSTAGSGCGRRA